VAPGRHAFNADACYRVAPDAFVFVRPINDPPLDLRRAVNPRPIDDERKHLVRKLPSLTIDADPADGCSRDSGHVYPHAKYAGVTRSASKIVKCQVLAKARAPAGP
jgi:hypothetical protein